MSDARTPGSVDYLTESNPVYDDDSGARRGAHAVVVVGYDDQRSAFKIANSWGTDWGIGGYGWIDYDASESLIWMAYVTEDVVASPDNERPGTASNPSPGRAATRVAVDTVLRWTRNARTTSFDVYLGVDPHLSALDFQGNVARAEFTPHLAPGSVYYWRIDARGAGGITQGPVWTFTTSGMLEEPEKAVSPSPRDGATEVGQNPELRWDSGGRTTSYDVYLGTGPVLGTREFQQTQATRTYYPRGLRAGTRHYWRIDAKNGQGTTRGEVWTFTTAGMLEEPEKAVHPSPADGATEVGQNPELRWDSGGRTTSYDVYLGTGPVLGATELQQTQATRTYHLRGLRAGTQYYWRIDAKNGQGTTMGDVWTFTTVDDIQPPVDTAPEFGFGSLSICRALNEPISDRLPSAKGGNGTLVYRLEGDLPPGITLSGTRLSGTPTVVGTYHATWIATDEDGDSDSIKVRIGVTSGPICFGE